MRTRELEGHLAMMSQPIRMPRSNGCIRRPSLPAVFCVLRLRRRRRHTSSSSTKTASPNIEPFKRPRADLRVLGEDASQLLPNYLIRRVREQYEQRRNDVRAALRSREAFLTRQAKLVDDFQVLLGELPEKTPLEAKVTGVVQADGYKIEEGRVTRVDRTTT